MRPRGEPGKDGTVHGGTMGGLTSLWELEGLWRLERDIVHADGTGARFEGECLFTRTGPRLLQEETGTLVTSTGRFAGSRRYVWSADEGRLVLHFEDMRPFHDISLGTPRPTARHDCPPDVYRVAYDFSRWPDWQATWRVTGPRKAYVMESTYRRPPAQAG